MDDSKTTYQPFAGYEETYKLHIDSNEHIRAVCSVMAYCGDKDQPERLYYATQGEIAPDHYDDESAVYELDNIYTIKTLWPALAQALFMGFPKIVEVKASTGSASREAVIVDEEKHNHLVRGEVMRARDDFLGKFGMTAFEAHNLLSGLTGNLSFPTINRMLHPEIPGLKTPSGDLKPSSSPGKPTS